MKHCDWNISCTNNEIENTAVHLFKYEREVAHTGQGNKDCAAMASAHKHEVRARETSFNTRRVLAQNLRA